MVIAVEKVAVVRLAVFGSYSCGGCGGSGCCCNG